VTLADKIEAITRALEFYADKQNYSGPRYISPGRDTPLDAFSVVMVDRGQRARDILEILHREIDADLHGSSTPS
jgi:hypothetical protein